MFRMATKEYARAPGVITSLVDNDNCDNHIKCLGLYGDSK